MTQTEIEFTRKVTVHTFGDTWEAYSASQSGEVKDGDVLVAGDVVGFLFKAWPVAVTEERGELHSFTGPLSGIEDAEDCHFEGDRKAREIAAARGLSLREF